MEKRLKNTEDSPESNESAAVAREKWEQLKTTNRFGVRMVHAEQYRQFLEGKLGGEIFAPYLIDRSQSMITYNPPLPPYVPPTFPEYLQQQAAGGWLDTAYRQTDWSVSTGDLRSSKLTTRLLREAHGNAKGPHIRADTYEKLAAILRQECEKDSRDYDRRHNEILRRTIPLVRHLMDGRTEGKKDTERLRTSLESMLEKGPTDLIFQKIESLVEKKVAEGKPVQGYFDFNINEILPASGIHAPGIEDHILRKSIEYQIREVAAFFYTEHAYKNQLLRIERFLNKPKELAESDRSNVLSGTNGQRTKLHELLHDLIATPALFDSEQNRQYQIAVIFDEEAIMRTKKNDMGWSDIRWKYGKDEDLGKHLLGAVCLLSDPLLLQKMIDDSSHARTFAHPVFRANGAAAYPDTDGSPFIWKQK